MMYTRFLRLLAVLLLAVTLFTSCCIAESADSTETEYVEIVFGSKGDDVREMQIRLKELGYYSKNIDGDFGNGTKTAIESFQSRNNLYTNGIASPETLALIFSDDAIPAPEPLELVVTDVTFDQYNANVTIQNNLDVTVDNVVLYALLYDAAGNITVADEHLTNENIGQCGTYTPGVAIKPHATASILLDISDDYNYSTKFIGICISEFHTSDGKNYAYSPAQMCIYKSDTSVQYPTDETDPKCLTDEVFKQANTVKFGFSGVDILPCLSSVYLYPSGNILFRINENSLFDLAGFQECDIILSYDEIDALSGFAPEYAKLRLLEGKTVKVHYWRANKTYTTEISLAMDYFVEQETPNVDTTYDTSIAEQLALVAELYENGYLTEEEYDAAKALILDGM